MLRESPDRRVGLGRAQEYLSQKVFSLSLNAKWHLVNEKYCQEQDIDEETPTEEGPGLQVPKVPGLPQTVDKVGIIITWTRCQCGQDVNVDNKAS